jgi:hypothetical protein
MLLKKLDRLMVVSAMLTREGFMIKQEVKKHISKDISNNIINKMYLMLKIYSECSLEVDSLVMKCNKDVILEVLKEDINIMMKILTEREDNSHLKTLAFKHSFSLLLFYSFSLVLF